MKEEWDAGEGEKQVEINKRQWATHSQCDSEIAVSEIVKNASGTLDYAEI